MEKDKENLIVYLVLLVAALSVITMFVVLASSTSEDEIKKIVASEIAKIPMPVEPVVPTAEDIVALIVIPEVVIPEFPNDERLREVWEKQYSDEIEEIEENAEEDAVAEIKDRDYRDLVKWLEANVENFDELHSDPDFDHSETEIEVTALGLERDEDKVASFYFEVDVRYELTEGVDQRYKDTVYVTGTVTYDEGDFDDEDVELMYSFDKEPVAILTQ